MAVVVKEVLARFRGDTKSLDAASKKAQNSIKGIGATATKTSLVVAKATKLMKASLAPLAALYALPALSGAVDEYKLLASRIENATRSAQEFKSSFKSLIAISKETGAELSATVDVFQRISFVRDEINATTEDMLQFTETVSKLGIVSGASTTALKSGLTQLGQSLSSGIVRAEEFNSIMENIPAVGVAIAEEFGVTTGQLRQLVIAGEVLSGDVFQAILNQAEKVNVQFEKMPMTIGRAFTQLRIRMMEAIGSIDQATGSSKVFIIAIDAVGRALGAVANLIKGYGNLLKGFFTIITGVITAAFVEAAKNIEKVINLTIKGINKFRKEGNKLDLINFAPEVDASDISKATGDMVAEDFKNAEEGFRDIINSLGDFSKESTVAIEKHGGEVIDLKEKYSNLSGASKDAGKAAAKAAKEAARELEKQKKHVQDLRNEMADMFADSVEGFDSMRDVAINAIKDIARNLLRLSFGGTSSEGIGGSIASAIFGAVGGAFGGGGGSFTTAGMTSNMQAALPGFATGGSMNVGGVGGTDSQLVSFKATPNERVTITKPGQSLGGGGGNSVSVSQTINVSTGVQQTVRAELSRFMPQIKEASVKAVDEALQRNKLRG